MLCETTGLNKAEVIQAFLVSCIPVVSDLGILSKSFSLWLPAPLVHAKTVILHKMFVLALIFLSYVLKSGHATFSKITLTHLGCKVVGAIH